MDSLNILASYGFISTINKPTRVTNGTSSCIDHCFMKTNKIMIENVIPMILETKITDHDPI